MPAMIFPPAPNDGDEVTQPNGTTYTYDAAKARWDIVSVAGGGGSSQLMIIRDEKPDGDNGGASTANNWQVRDLNTLPINEIAGASIAANQIILPAGTYRITIRSPGYQSGRGRARLYDVTNAVGVILGENWQSDITGVVTIYAEAFGQIIVAAPTTFEVQHWMSAADSAGLGRQDGATLGPEVYTTVKIEKVA